MNDRAGAVVPTKTTRRNGESAPPVMTKQIVVRVPDDLHAALMADALGYGRTVAQSVRFHLRAALSGRTVPRGEAL